MISYRRLSTVRIHIVHLSARYTSKGVSKGVSVIHQSERFQYTGSALWATGRWQRPACACVIRSVSWRVYVAQKKHTKQNQSSSCVEMSLDNPTETKGPPPSRLGQRRETHARYLSQPVEPRTFASDAPKHSDGTALQVHQTHWSPVPSSICDLHSSADFAERQLESPSTEAAPRTAAAIVTKTALLARRAIVQTLW